MAQGDYWLAKYDSGSAVAHNLDDLCSHVLPVAVYPALGTDRLGFGEYTVLQALSAIFQQGAALFTEFCTLPVIVSAIQAD